MAGQGFKGGNTTIWAGCYGSGGGGGAAEEGKPTLNTSQAGAGGAGKNYTINGTNIYYAGGGGGGCFDPGTGGAGGNGGGGAGTGGTNTATNGTANTGGGGGGSGSGGTAGQGGSGIVIVRYLTDTGGASDITANLTVNAGTGGNALGNVTNLNITAGASSPINAYQNAGYTFSNWSITSGNCTIVDAANNATTADFLNTTSNCVILASFIQDTANLSVNSNATEGNATGNSSNFFVPANTSINATENTGFAFSNWSITSGNCTIINSTNPNTFAQVLVITECVVQANYVKIVVCNLTTSSSIGGTTTGGTSTACGTWNNITAANISSFYSFINWTLTGNCTLNLSSNQSANSIAINAGNCNANANFVFTLPSTPPLMNVTIIQPNISNMGDVLILANNIIGAPFPTFFTFGMVLTISLIITFSLVPFFKLERAIAAGSTIGLLLTLILALGGPQLMNIYYAGIFTFFLLVGIWATVRAKEATI